MDFGIHAAMVAGLIAQAGTDITLSDGETKIRPYVAERISKIKEVVPQAQIDAAKGRLVLFYLTPTDLTKIPNGEQIRYDGEFFTLSPAALAAAGGVKNFVAILGASGGYGQ